MPIYEYECAKCGKTFEVIQKMTDKPLKRHQGCGGSLTKLVSAAGFQFKGSGWYVTDYARKDTKTESKEAKDTSSNGKQSKESAGGVKPEAERAGKKDSAAKSGGAKKD